MPQLSHNQYNNHALAKVDREEYQLYNSSSESGKITDNTAIKDTEKKDIN